VKFHRALFLILIFLLGVSGDSALAARKGVVELDEIELKETASKSGKVLEKLKKGEQVVASNLPLEGFYKVRTSSGTLGWIQEGQLTLEPVPPSDPEATDGDSKSDPKDPFKKPKEPERIVRQTIRFRGMGGLQMLSMNNMVPNYTISQSLYYGGDLAILFTPGFGIVFRGEQLRQQLNLTSSGSSNAYQVQLASLPVMGGLEFGVLGDHFSVHVSILGGVGLQSSIKVVGTTDSTQGSVSAVMPLAALLKGDVTWQMSHVFGLFGEVGFRYLYAGGITPGGNSPALVSPSNLDFRGAFFGGGLSIGF